MADPFPDWIEQLMDGGVALVDGGDRITAAEGEFNPGGDDGLVFYDK